METGPAGGEDTVDALLRLQKAFSSPAVGVLSFKLGGQMLDANEPLQRMSGYSADELRRIPWDTLTPPEFMERTMRAAHDLATRGETMPYEKQWIRPDGSRWWGLFAPTRLRGEGPETECLEFIIDITERKQAEAVARAERQKLHDIFQQAPVAICILEGPRYTYTFANPPYLALYGYPDLIGKPLAEALPKIAAEFTAILDQVVASGEPFTGTEYPMHIPGRPAGELVYVNYVYQPLRDANDNVHGVLACGSDVTSQVLARKELEAERELRERFVAMLSHDLRTPLSSARMGAELIMSQGGSAEVVQRASRIAETIDRADQMLRDLLDANRVKAGERLHLELSRCKLAAVADDTLRELASVHGDRFLLRADDDADGMWSCGGVRRILENLCTNAVKYGDDHAPITVTITCNAEAAFLAVHNHGPPIPARDIPTLFQPFQRIRSTGTTKANGWGLGLTLVRGVAEAHGGHVGVTSSAAAGTTFTVMLPHQSG